MLDFPGAQKLMLNFEGNVNSLQYQVAVLSQKS